MKNQVTEFTRNHIWNEIIDVARLSRYYETLHRRYQWKHNAVKIAVVIASIVGSGIAVLGGEPSRFAYPFASLVVLSAIVWGHSREYEKKAAILHVVTEDCAKLDSLWNQLWVKVSTNQTDEETAVKENQQLSDRLSEATARPGSASIEHDPKLNYELGPVAVKVVKNHYAHLMKRKEHAV